MRAALLQISSQDDPPQNLEMVRGLLRDAARDGAGFVLTPEVTNCLGASRAHQTDVLALEDDDIFLAGLRDQAAALGIWLSIGSLALKTRDPDGRFANRSFLIDPSGEILARYDKIHMFDVKVSESESYHESKAYRPGEAAVVAKTPFASIGLSICYDLRFPHLYRDLAKAGAEVLIVPSAFSPVTGKAHWYSLLRARAIETGCWILAAAQTGTHGSGRAQRKTYGHSLVVSPWGEVLVDGGDMPGVITVDLDMRQVQDARGRIASLTHDRPYSGP